MEDTLKRRATEGAECFLGKADAAAAPAAAATAAAAADAAAGAAGAAVAAAAVAWTAGHASLVVRRRPMYETRTANSAGFQQAF